MTLVLYVGVGVGMLVSALVCCRALVRVPVGVLLALCFLLEFFCHCGLGKVKTTTATATTIATTATLPLRIVGLVDDDANNDYASAGAHLLVRLNAHFNAGTRSFASQTTADSTGI